MIEEFEDPEEAEPLSAYREMARDQDREREALEWCEALIGDALDDED
jgi:hypothetical protein